MNPYSMAYICMSQDEPPGFTVNPPISCQLRLRLRLLLLIGILFDCRLPELH